MVGLDHRAQEGGYTDGPQLIIPKGHKGMPKDHSESQGGGGCRAQRGSKMDRVILEQPLNKNIYCIKRHFSFYWIK